MVRARRWLNLAVFVLLAAGAVWWLARNWNRTAAGGATVPAQAGVTAPSSTPGVDAAAAVDGVPVLAAAGNAKAPAAPRSGQAHRTTPASGAAPTAAGAKAAAGGAKDRSGKASGAQAPRTGSSSTSAGSGGAAGAPKQAGAGSAASVAAYFASAHMQRAQAESRELAELQSMADDASASAAVRSQAQEQILQLDAMRHAESLAEMVLQAKGFARNIVILSANGAVVVVQAAHFDAAMAASVAQAVAEVASLQPDQIQIVARP